MSGLLLIAIIIGYITLVAWIAYTVKSRAYKILIVILAALMPTADEVYNKYKLNQYCKNDSGLKIYSTVSRKYGIVDDSASHPDYLKTKLVSFVERKDDISGKIYRFERQSDNSVKKIYIKKITAPYQFLRREKKDGAFIKTELMVVERDDEKVLGKLTDYNYYGGWFRRYVLGGISDSGPVLVNDCGISEAAIGKIRLINSVYSDN